MENGKTIVSLSNEVFNTEYIAKLDWDCNVHKMASVYYGLLRSAGYQHRSIALVLDCEETYETRQELELIGEL